MRYLLISIFIFCWSAPSCAGSSEEAIEEADEYDEFESLEQEAAVEEEEEENEEEIEFEDDDDQEEMSSAEDVFQKLDFDKDGMLSATEIFAHDESIGSREAQKVARMASKFLVELPDIDKDADALISRDELPSLLEWVQKEDNLAVFNDLDTNKDGHLTAEEIFATQEKDDPDLAEKLQRHFYEHLSYIDQDGDAMVSPAELPALLEISYDYERESRKIGNAKKEEEPDVATEQDEEDEDLKEQNEKPQTEEPSVMS